MLDFGAAVRCASLALLCGGLLASVCAPAHAQRTSSLGWVRLKGTESCIATQTLAERVERRLGRRVFVSASQADLALEGHVERRENPSGFVATLVVSDRSGRELGQRVLSVAGTRCAELEASLVLVIAIAIDPGALLHEPDAPLSSETGAMLAQLGLPQLTEEQIRQQLAVPDTSPAAEHKPESKYHARDSSSSERASRPTQSGRGSAGQAQARSVSRWREPQPGSGSDDDDAGAVRLRGVFLRINSDVGALPSPAVGLVLGAWLGWPGWVLELWLSGMAPQRQDAAGDGRVNIALVRGGAGLCPALLGFGRVVFRGCAGTQLGIIYGHGRDFVRSFTRIEPWLEPTLYGGLSLRMGGLMLDLVLGAGAPVIRDSFRYQSATGQLIEVHRAAPLSARVELGAGASF